MDGSPHHIIGYQLRGKSQIQVYDSWSATYELRRPRYGELTIDIGGMQRVSAHDPC